MLDTKSKTLGKVYNEKLVLIPTPALKHPEAALGLGVLCVFQREENIRFASAPIITGFYIQNSTLLSASLALL